MKTKICRVCNEEKTEDLLIRTGVSVRTGEPLYKNICKKCKNKMRETSRLGGQTEARKASNKRRTLKFAEKNRLSLRDKYLRSSYGITLEDYGEMLAAQGEKCAICQQDRKLFVDHCHTTGKIRGLLCNQCNSALGLLGENVEAFIRAGEYLK